MNPTSPKTRAYQHCKREATQKLLGKCAAWEKGRCYVKSAIGEPGQGVRNISLEDAGRRWYRLAERTDLGSDFWKAFAVAHRFDRNQTDGIIQLRLTNDTMATHLFDALLVLYELCDRWNLLWELLPHDDQCLLIVARPTVAVSRDIQHTTRWVAVADRMGLSIDFWYAFAAAHGLDADEMGPETSRYLKLAPDTTTAEGLFDALFVVRALNELRYVDWDLTYYERVRAVVVVESSVDEVPYAPNGTR